MMLDRKLEELLKAKKYSALSADEKALVSKSLTEKEYNRFRMILCGSRNSLNNIDTAPSPRVKQNLMAAMSAKRRQKQPLTVAWNSFASSRIPVWQAAAAFAILMFCTMLLKQQVVFIENSPAEPLMVYKTDTVFETVYKTDTVFEEVPVYLSGKKNINVKPGATYHNSNEFKPSNALFSNTTEREKDENKFPFDFLETNQLLADSTPVLKQHFNPSSNSWLDIPARGRNAKDDADLLQFLTEIN